MARKQSAAHTAGPWVHKPSANDYGLLIARCSKEERGSCTKGVASVHGQDTEAEQEANIRLIASAPDLLRERDNYKALSESLRKAVANAHRQRDEERASAMRARSERLMVERQRDELAEIVKRVANGGGFDQLIDDARAALASVEKVEIDDSH